jgi:hypothetical protein
VRNADYCRNLFNPFGCRAHPFSRVFWCRQAAANTPAENRNTNPVLIDELGQSQAQTVENLSVCSGGKNLPKTNTFQQTLSNETQ